ncbi:unnamed protein product [Pleuronectes platessa]|uniref:Uncharacterized protein n=1 Tax=Pleuronectes platessa TaxID=8262 RepID=A0A9N7YYJ2_PLEPL|nr:unnamed protein product [Pleuronectes platessa]
MVLLGERKPDQKGTGVCRPSAGSALAVSLLVYQAAQVTHSGPDGVCHPGVWCLLESGPLRSLTAHRVDKMTVVPPSPLCGTSSPPPDLFTAASSFPVCLATPPGRRIRRADDCLCHQNGVGVGIETVCRKQQFQAELRWQALSAHFLCAARQADARSHTHSHRVGAGQGARLDSGSPRLYPGSTQALPRLYHGAIPPQNAPDIFLSVCASDNSLLSAPTAVKRSMQPHQQSPGPRLLLSENDGAL